MKSNDMLPTLDMETYQPPAQEQKQHPASQAAQLAAQVQEQGMQQMMSELAQQGDSLIQKNRQGISSFFESLSGMMAHGNR